MERRGGNYFGTEGKVFSEFLVLSDLKNQMH